MFIKRLEFKNINSYGNNLQVLEFDEKGGLILLCGENGSGKSTIKQAIELCLFGKVQGKTGKKLALTKLPNRRNGSLYAGIYFKNNRNQEIIIKRYIQPKNFEIYVDGVPFDEEYKKMTEEEREDFIIGFNFEVFKSFISLNINDFKNFISLSKEDKENLLNKLFNINDLDILYSITKDIDINNQKTIANIENEILKNNDMIQEYTYTIQNIKMAQEKTKNDKIKELKDKITSKKSIFLEYKKELNHLENQKNELNNKLAKIHIESEKLEEKTKLETQINALMEKIKIFENGICPFCDSDLHDKKNTYINKINNEIALKRKQMEDCINMIEKSHLESIKIKETINNIHQKILNIQHKIIELNSELTMLKKEYTSLLNDQNDVNVINLENKINELREDNKQKTEILKNLKRKSELYKELKNIFSVDGIRKSIIKNAIKPINEYLEIYLKEMNSEYRAQLNENFDADIFELGILNIDPETLSKGEDKKINIAIALSYLNFILKLRKTNIIFLDEIFDGIDINNINLILNVLKNIALENNINIIIVSHGIEQIVDMNIFDKIIRTNKVIFSNIEIIENKK